MITFEEGGGVLWHGLQTEKIEEMDHWYQDFLLPNHENKQARYPFNDMFLH